MPTAHYSEKTVLRHRCGGYDRYSTRDSWFGTKGLVVTPTRCGEMQFVMGNLSLDQYAHFDMRLKQRVKTELDPNIEFVRPMVGHGHRPSWTDNRGAVFFVGGGLGAPPCGYRPRNGGLLHQELRVHFLFIDSELGEEVQGLHIRLSFVSRSPRLEQ